jgi:hypothetical protein
MTSMLAHFDLKDVTEFRENRYTNKNESKDFSEEDRDYKRAPHSLKLNQRNLNGM